VTTNVLAIPATVYGALRALLSAANMTAPIHGEGDDEVIHLRGVTLRSQGGSWDTDLIVSSLLSQRTKAGRVELSVNGQLTQMDLPKAREVVGMLQGAIEAAVSDQLLFAFLTGPNVGLTSEQAGAALLDFRELRQGSRDVVHPH
jgi:hypothetical protein